MLRKWARSEIWSNSVRDGEQKHSSAMVSGDHTWKNSYWNGMLLSHKRELTWVGSNEVDEPRVCYTEWSKSERKKTNIIY